MNQNKIFRDTGWMVLRIIRPYRMHKEKPHSDKIWFDRSTNSYSRSGKNEYEVYLFIVIE